eukprot:scaffold30103_cov36-Cyclotella_meneghiniana.AAC.1
MKYDVKEVAGVHFRQFEIQQGTHKIERGSQRITDFAIISDLHPSPLGNFWFAPSPAPTYRHCGGCWFVATPWPISAIP